MKCLGIEFAPLNVPLQRRLQTFSAFFMVFMATYMGIFGIFLFVYLLFVPVFWPLLVPYVIWLVLDRKTPERGGRSIDWIRSSPVFDYAQKYFPIKLNMKSDFKPDPKRNYLFCFFPHGAITTGPLIGLLSKTFDGKILFPKHKIKGVTLHGSFKIPFYRDIILALGFCSATVDSINYVLGDPNGGQILGLIVGGAAEAFYCDGGHYRLVLKNRKGFVKLALKNGCPLVPVFSFGETRLFKQVSFPEGGRVWRFQKWLQKILGIAPIIIHGRGFFQYSLGMVPFRKQIALVVGDPIEVSKVENPTQKEIDSLHEKFIDALTGIFEKYKNQYEEDPANCSLTIS